MSKYVFSVGLAILLLVMSGCGTDPEVQLAEISRNTIVYDEIVRLNNCGGKGDTDQVVTREFAATIEFGAGITGGYKSIVEGSISAKYSEYRNTSKSLRVVAPPGTNMEFVLRWSDDVRAGNVQVNGKSGTYEVRIPVSVEQISGQDLGCGVFSSSSSGQLTPVSPDGPNQSARTIVPTAIVPASSTRIPIECAPYPVNPQDGVEVLLDESTWYVIEEFDNSQSPPIHRFWARKGPGSVIVILPRGMRAWACINEQSALYTAMQSATGFKASHPDYEVYGPDGSEVK